MTELQKKFRELSKHPETIVVNYPGDSVSPGPLYSRGYANCNAVVLLAENVAGLTHYDSRVGSEIYLNEIINRMARQGQFPDNAVVVGGDERHMDRNLRILYERGINIANGYSDGEDDIPLLTEEIFKGLRLKLKRDKGHKRLWGLKDILVVPETQEVLVHRQYQGDFIKLS